MRLLHWLSDWRNGATVLASVLVALVAYVTIDASIARNQAVDSKNQSTIAATRRIDKLNDRIRDLGEELVRAANKNGQRIGELTSQITALEEQVRQLGGRPVVVTPTTTTSTTGPPRTSPPTSTSTTSTTTPRRCAAGIVCLN